MTFESHHLYRVALSLVENIGSVRAKQLVSYCGSAEAVFQSKTRELEKIPGISSGLISNIQNKHVLQYAEKEIEFCLKNGISIFYYLEEDYPNRLRPYEDSPTCLYYKGSADLNKVFHVAIVGTRTPTERGRWIVEKMIEDFVSLDVQIISGLAYGIDAEAHKASLKNGLSTIGVVAHGLDTIYPKVHLSLAKDMSKNGGLLTEFPSGTIPDRERFPARNRIIAGLADAVIVVESKASGGSMITANFANEYNKDVFAIPGRPQDEFSKGCNKLIQENKAHLIEEAQDVINIMRWEKKTDALIQRSLFLDLTSEQQKIISLIKIGVDDIDSIIQSTGMPSSQLSAILLELEFNGMLKSLPGKKYMCLD